MDFNRLAKDRKIVITGASGYIGSEVARNLVKYRHEVRALHRPGPVPKSLLAYDAHGVDVIDRQALELAMVDADIVIHLVGVGTPSSPSSLFRNILSTNVLGTQAVMDAATASGVRRVVLVSSSAVYGRAGASVLQEDMPVLPTSIYGTTKFAMERIAAAYAATGQLETVSLRVFNVFGSGQFLPSQQHLLIPQVIRRMIAGQPIVIRGDGMQTRDFVHIDDVVEVLLTAALQDESPAPVINVGTGHPTTVRDVVDVIAERLDIDPLIEREEIGPGEILDAIADISVLKESLGLVPQPRIQEFLLNFPSEELSRFSQ